MAIEEVEKLVPVREGDYGDRVVAVEPGGIEYIPERERHGRPLNLLWTWMSPNLEFATIFVGIVPIVLFGGGFWPTVLGVTLGITLGSITHGILSSWGPKFAVPQLVQSRAAFGYIGNILPAGLQSLTAGIGWYAVNTVAGAFALQTLFGQLLHLGSLPYPVAVLIIVIAQVAAAFMGHNMVHQVEKVLVPYLALVFALATVLIISKASLGTDFNPKAPAAIGGPSAAFIIAVAVAYGYVIGWNPYASDYTRYLPSNADRFRVGLAAGGGMWISNVVLMVMGAALATVAGTKWGPGTIPTDQFIFALPAWLAVLSMLGIAVGSVAANAINIYSSAISFLALGVKWGFKQRRAAVALITGVFGFLVALLGQTSPGGRYEQFLLVIAYWITPFLAVILSDYWLRRGEYDERLYFDAGYRPWKGALAMILGIAASIPFWNQELYLGPVPKAYPQIGDISFFVGFVVSALVYLGLNWGLRGEVASKRALASSG